MIACNYPSSMPPVSRMVEMLTKLIAAAAVK
jgi:hypothetical protein